jgi:hypothetical protein
MLERRDHVTALGAGHLLGDRLACEERVLSARLQSKVAASVCADGNDLVPSARMPLGPSSEGSVGTPRLASDAKSPSAIATFWSKVIAASSSSARWPGGWLASRHGSPAASAEPAMQVGQDHYEREARDPPQHGHSPDRTAPLAKNLMLTRDLSITLQLAPLDT